MGAEKQPEITKSADVLSPEDLGRLLDKYGEYGLREGKDDRVEYLILPITQEDGTEAEIFMHKFKKLGEIPIEDRIREHLKLPPK